MNKAELEIFISRMRSGVRVMGIGLLMYAIASSILLLALVPFLKATRANFPWYTIPLFWLIILGGAVLFVFFFFHNSLDKTKITKLRQNPQKLLTVHNLIDIRMLFLCIGGITLFTIVFVFALLASLY
jgi:hypothetical protein